MDQDFGIVLEENNIIKLDYTTRIYIGFVLFF